MAYSDFTLDRVETQFGLTTSTDEDYFAAVDPVPITTRFLRLIGTSVYVDRTEYYLRDVEKIVGILLSMLHEAAEQQLANGAA